MCNAHYRRNQGSAAFYISLACGPFVHTLSKTEKGRSREHEGQNYRLAVRYCFGCHIGDRQHVGNPEVGRLARMLDSVSHYPLPSSIQSSEDYTLVGCDACSNHIYGRSEEHT